MPSKHWIDEIHIQELDLKSSNSHKYKYNCKMGVFKENANITTETRFQLSTKSIKMLIEMLFAKEVLKRL